ncbi:MAG TPA: hypothetical protein VGO47_07135 [Chlamydiales bacterium]|nr:hypothetical protein [Chlamydiales bacterium]
MTFAHRPPLQLIPEFFYILFLFFPYRIPSLPEDSRTSHTLDTTHPQGLASLGLEGEVLLRTAYVTPKTSREMHLVSISP